MKRPNADNLFQSIKDSTSGLNEANFLQLAMDGPNVNWLVLNKLDDVLISNRHEKTVNIGSCAQHMVMVASKLELQMLVGTLIRS